MIQLPSRAIFRGFLSISLVHWSNWSPARRNSCRRQSQSIPSDHSSSESLSSWPGCWPKNPKTDEHVRFREANSAWEEFGLEMWDKPSWSQLTGCFIAVSLQSNSSVRETGTYNMIVRLHTIATAKLLSSIWWNKPPWSKRKQNLRKWFR